MDSSALFAAILSPKGAARELIRLAVIEEIQLIISEDVATETRRNVSCKAPELLSLLKWYPVLQRTQFGLLKNMLLKRTRSLSRRPLMRR